MLQFGYIIKSIQSCHMKDWARLFYTFLALQIVNRREHNYGTIEFHYIYFVD